MSDTERFPAFDAERSAAIRRMMLDQIPAPRTTKQRRSRDGRPALIGVLMIMALFVVGGVYLAVHGGQTYSTAVGNGNLMQTYTSTPSPGGGRTAGTDSGAGTNDGGPFGRSTSGVNARGQTYGPLPTTSDGGANAGLVPDLVLEHGTAGAGALVTGYVPSDVYSNAPVDSVVPLYASDGITKVGTWVVKRSGSPSR